MDRPPFPELHYDELQRIVRQEAPELVELAGSVGSDWLDDAAAAALADVALNDISASMEQQRRSFWEENRPATG